MKQPESLAQAHECRKMRQDYERHGMPGRTHIQEYAVHFFGPFKDNHHVMIITRIVSKDFYAHKKPFDSIKAGSLLFTLTPS